MIVASHMVAGAAVGVLCKRARVAVLVAFASHFVLDQIPHSCFNMLPESSRTGLAGLLVAGGMALDCAIVLLTLVLAWRLSGRWRILAASFAAFLPDPLSYLSPVKEWFAMMPGAWVVPWVHRTFHCDVTHSHLALGFITQVVVIAAAMYVLVSRRHKTNEKRGE